MVNKNNNNNTKLCDNKCICVICIANTVYNINWNNNNNTLYDTLNVYIIINVQHINNNDELKDKLDVICYDTHTTYK